MITQHRLQELLRYDPATGLFTAILDRGKRVKAGHVENRFDSLGYRTVVLDGTKYRQHRLVWLYVYGVWPTVVDHIDGDTTNNRVGNLREATIAENVRNQKRSRANKSGFKGVYFEAITGQWRAEIKMNKVKHRLGRFDNILDARDAYAAAARRLHGDFARTE